MSLNAAHERQIAQFLLIAEGYLELASSAATITETLGMTKARFWSPATVGGETRRLAMVGAHLSSAAIRLASIEDVLGKAGVPRRSYTECRDYFSGRSQLPATDNRAQNCSEWIHVMLRDNAAHEEPDESPTRLKEVRWRERQDCLVSLTFAATYAKVKEITLELVRQMKADYGIQVTVV
jgi:hypothetical protein